MEPSVYHERAAGREQNQERGWHCGRSAMSRGINSKSRIGRCPNFAPCPLRDQESNGMQSPTILFRVIRLTIHYRQTWRVPCERHLVLRTIPSAALVNKLTPKSTAHSAAKLAVHMAKESLAAFPSPTPLRCPARLRCTLYFKLRTLL